MRYAAFLWKSCMFLFIVFMSCVSENDKKELPTYDGPLSVTHNLEIHYSDSAELKLIVKAPMQQEYMNGNQEFPKGLFVEFYENNEVLTSTLKANYGINYKKENYWMVRGDVVLKNMKEEKTLLTEELYWDPATRKVYTDKFVKIITPTDMITGTGLETTEDFKEYTLKKVGGEMEVN